MNIKKFINRQKYQECQLIESFNAAIFLGLLTVRQASEKYERLVDFVCARYGSAIDGERVHEQLGISYEKGRHNIRTISKTLRQGKHPVGFGVWHESVGFHAVLAIDIDDSRIQIPNFKAVTDDKGWVDIKVLEKLLDGGKNIHPHCGSCYIYRAR